MLEYDIVIVGVGPGGSTAAKEAAEKGLKTIFFERGRRPGEKNSSGSGLGPRLWRDFDFMKEVLPLLNAILGEDKMDLLTNPERLLTEMPEIEEAITNALMDYGEEDGEE